ncbi:MAG: hypothetical protein PHE79_11950 [Eubacteriales bacterium]|nr:hypothetical protein [Eubacteriales bacterium]
MVLNKILLIEKDKEYGRALATAMSNLQNDFEITIIDFEEDKEKEPFDSFDLILIGGYSLKNLKSRAFLELYMRKLVILTEYPTEVLLKQIKNENRKCWYLYKYVRLSEMVSDLSFLTTLLTGKKHYTKNSITPNMISFYSAGGGVGKTAIAIAAARELSRFHDKKILYLSFEDIPDTELYIKSKPLSRNIGDYLYYLLEKQDDNLCGRLESFVSKDNYGVETFFPSGGLNDLRQLSNEELNNFLETICNSNRYDFIIMDLNCDLSKDTQFLLEQCNKIVLIQSDRPVSGFKNRKLITHMENIGLIKSLEVLLLVINKRAGHDFDPDHNEDDNTKKYRQIYIEDDKASFSFVNNSMEISINHSFGIGVKKIADELLIP